MNAILIHGVYQKLPVQLDENNELAEFRLVKSFLHTSIFIKTSFGASYELKYFDVSKAKIEFERVKKVLADAKAHWPRPISAVGTKHVKVPDRGLIRYEIRKTGWIFKDLWLRLVYENRFYDVPVSDREQASV